MSSSLPLRLLLPLTTSLISPPTPPDSHAPSPLRSMNPNFNRRSSSSSSSSTSCSSHWQLLPGRIRRFRSYIPMLNHDDSRHETTWRLFTAQPQNTTKKNHPKSYYHEEVMGVTSQQFSDASDKDLRSHNESFRPDQEGKGNKSNCSRTPTNHKHAAKWNQPIISSHEGDIVFLKQRILHLLYLEAHGFWRLQTYHWRPGDFMILLQTSYNILGCTNMHRIKWIKLEPNFPFSDPFDINAQRLFPLTLVRLPELYSVNLDIPRHHQYSPKLSRLKHKRLFPYSAEYTTISSNGHMH